ncbi:unnamed protein product, partial [Rotaria sordida]
ILFNEEHLINRIRILIIKTLGVYEKDEAGKRATSDKAD